MTYGLKDPQKVLDELGDVAIPVDSFESCPICYNETPFDGHRYPLGRIRFPNIAADGVEQRVTLGCSKCYIKQTRCNFYTIEELRQARTTHKGRGRPPSESVQVTTREVREDDDIDLIIADLRKIIRRLRGLQKANRSATHFVAQPELPIDEMLDAMIAEHSDDIEQDAKDSALKSSLVPEEWWNDKTTRQILDIHAEKIGQRYDPELGAFVPYDF